jgi:CspA family cold shock protein
MPNGTVKFFNAAKGFGFITPEEGDKDVFVPAGSVTAAGLSKLKPGQRISFTVEPDGKGPKAVNLALIADAKPARVEKPAAARPAEPRLTFYHDPSWDKSLDALADLCEAGHQPHIVEYLTAPPPRDELKRLSLLLRDSDQSLVRKYDPLFMELRLDDRFISENEFWDAIVEHPSLINGPIVATASQARVCQSESAVKSFLAGLSSTGVAPPVKPKGLPERALKILAGDLTAADVAKEKAVSQKEPVPDAPAPSKAKEPARKKAAKPASEDKKPKAKVTTAPKPDAKAKKAAKKAPAAAAKRKTVPAKKKK